MRKTLIHIFTIADYEEEEMWLREQHRSGWKIVKMTPPCFYTFESCEPEDVIYRLDYKNSGQTYDYMRMWDGCISENLRLQLKRKKTESCFRIMRPESSW